MCHPFNIDTNDRVKQPKIHPPICQLPKHYLGPYVPWSASNLWEWGQEIYKAIRNLRKGNSRSLVRNSK